jgi:hypothetical protein
MLKKLRLPSPAFVLAVVALFVALSSTAVAASVVPLARRALQADNARRLAGRTPAQVAALPGPATSASGLVTIKTASFSLGPNAGADVIVACDAGRKAVGGGFDSNGPVFNFDTRPMANGSAWAIYLANPDEASGHSGTAYAVCLR